MWLRPSSCPDTTNLSSHEGDTKICFDWETWGVYAQKEEESGFLVNMTTVLRLSHRMELHRVTLSGSGVHCQDPLSGQTLLNWQDRHIIQA